MKQSVRDISSEVTNVNRVGSQEFAARVKEINEDTNRQLLQLQKDADDARNQVQNDPQYYDKYGRYESGRANSAMIRIERDLDTKTRAVQYRQSHDLSDAQSNYNQRQVAAEASATAIERTYASGNSNPNLKLTPLGTNMYTRNYQTLGEPSGAPMTIAAPPAKSLSQH